MLDKTKRYLVVGLGLLGGKYALELTKAGFHVDGINRSEGHLQYALEHGPHRVVPHLRPSAQARLHLYRCFRRKDRPCGAGAGHVPGGRGVHCQPPDGRP